MVFWADKIVNEIEKKLSKTIMQKAPLLVRDEKTLSGRVHIGSMRGVAIHGIVNDVLNERGISSEFQYELNDFDAMDDIPSYLDKNEYEKYLGVQLYKIPSPDGSAENFAEYFGREFVQVIKDAGFDARFYRLSEVYKSGKMDEAIEKAILNKDKIREIYKRVSGSEKPEDWLPVQVVCQNCGKISTTKAISFDGKEVTYVCKEDQVKWAKGCGHKGKTSPFKGGASLPWKVEWAAKFYALGVDVEGAGKDHSTKGGARDVANAIAKEVYGIKPPFDIPYEFFLVGGAKMSSSKGRGSSAKEISEMLPKEIFRTLLLAKRPMQTIDFNPEGDTIPNLFDLHDSLAEDYWSSVESDTVILFGLIYKNNPPEKMFLPRFSTVAYLVQMPHVSLVEEFEKIKEDKLTEAEKYELQKRVKYAQSWLEKYAPEKYIFKIRQNLPNISLTDIQKSALGELLKFIENNKSYTGEQMHAKLHEIKKESGIDPREFFSAIYRIILDKDSGPKAGWFLSVLDRDFLINRLKEAIK